MSITAASVFVDDHQEALVSDGIPFNSFGVEDVQAEYERLTALGVRFVQQPARMGPMTTAVLEDTCGNLVQIAAKAAPEPGTAA